MDTEKKKLGDAGERMAARFLEGKGYRIVARQAGIPRVGEIDLVAYDPRGGELVFAEVKTRHDARFGPPEEAVTRRKLERMMRVAELWRVRSGWHARPWRVDVIAVDLSGHETVIRHHEGIQL